MEVNKDIKYDSAKKSRKNKMIKKLVNLRSKSTFNVSVIITFFRNLNP